MILAAKDIGLDKETIRRLEACMTYQMDMLTEEEATRIFQSF